MVAEVYRGYGIYVSNMCPVTHAYIIFDNKTIECHPKSLDDIKRHIDKWEHAKDFNNRMEDLSNF